MDGATIHRIALGEDRHPDAWQLALAGDAWPRVLIAPTGSGKTAAVTLGWATRRLHSPDDTPRRLVWCLPMRTLVEQTARAVEEWLRKLATDEVNGEGRLPRPEDVRVLMGGVDANGWLERPERPAVLVGTQDMLLSRALMRGYASSRALWPMEFALLHEDAQWVFDEVQLMGAGRATSAQLDAFRQSEAERARRDGRAAGARSRSLWISATLDPDWLATVDHPAPAAAAVVQVDADAAPGGRLAKLARAPKRLTRSPAAPASAKKADIADYVGRLADEIVIAHRDGRMTLAIVNRVDRAQALRDAIEKRLPGRPAAPALALVHSRFRAADPLGRWRLPSTRTKRTRTGASSWPRRRSRRTWTSRRPSCLPSWPPWSSLVQRFGRANRYAELPDGADVRWTDLLRPAADATASDKEHRGAGEALRDRGAAGCAVSTDRVDRCRGGAPSPARRRRPTAPRDPPQGPR